VSDFSHQSKTQLRTALLATRRSRIDRTRADAGVRAELDLLARGRHTVAAYAPLPDEPGGIDLPDHLALLCHRLLLPVLRPDRDLDWAEYADPACHHGVTPDRRPPLTPSARPDQRGPLTPSGTPDQYCALDRRGPLMPGAFGLREPSGPRLGPAAIVEADLVVVPALAVDRRGVRLGRGGGSYDRALTRAVPDALIVAVLYDGELVEALPAEPHDRRVHAVVTPHGLIRL
jgi:5-formyltetrahydrofolate cyclo-ligase